MSFVPQSGRGGHLDLTGDREVVYCHHCANEWYNDEHGLQCPRCSSDICEIVSPALPSKAKAMPALPPMTQRCSR